MDKKKRVLLELGKGLLILALTCNAVYMAADLFVVGGLGSLWQKETEATEELVETNQPLYTVTPVRIAITQWNGSTAARYGVQYDRESCLLEYQGVASLLREALSSKGESYAIPELVWQSALCQTTNLYFDLLGRYPLAVLMGWMGGEPSGVTGTVRRLVLSTDGTDVTLFYRDEESGEYLARPAELLTPQQLELAAASVVDNGARFAFELEDYLQLGGSTMLLPQEPEPKVYQAANPLSGERSDQIQPGSVLEKFLLALSFPDSSYIYSGTDQVIRSGNDTLRISADGTVRYAAPEGESTRYQFPIQEERTTALEAAQACRVLAEGTVGALAGEGRIFLKEMRPTEAGWVVTFGYCLDGIEVQVGQNGYAAQFQIKGNEITHITLQMRSYSWNNSRSYVLPERQAVAAMEALELQGRALTLVYQNAGEQLVTAGWAVE